MRLTLSPGVLEEQFYDVDMFRAGEGVTTNTDDEGLTEANAGCLRDGLVREGSRTRDDT